MNWETTTNKDTVMTHAKTKINETTSKVYVLTTWKKFLLFWSYLGLAYYLMLVYIAPLLKQVFLIADWSSLVLFYGLTAILALLIGVLYSFVMKILLYIFN